MSCISVACKYAIFYVTAVFKTLSCLDWRRSSFGCCLTLFPNGFMLLLCCHHRALEEDLALARQERDTLNQQLLNTIRHKVALSQEVESWQVCERFLFSAVPHSDYRRRYRKCSVWCHDFFFYLGSYEEGWHLNDIIRYTEEVFNYLAGETDL